SVLLIELLCRPALDLGDRHAAASDGEPAGRRKASRSNEPSERGSLTAATAILTALLAGLSVLLIELLCRPALDLGDRHAAASDGEPAGRRK
ncbi:hypothetical protein CTI14_63810, partial [Methylobacterium radiotolerans]